MNEYVQTAIDRLNTFLPWKIQSGLTPCAKS